MNKDHSSRHEEEISISATPASEQTDCTSSKATTTGEMKEKLIVGLMVTDEPKIIETATVTATDAQTQGTGQASQTRENEANEREEGGSGAQIISDTSEVK